MEGGYRFPIKNAPVGDGDLCPSFLAGQYTCEHGHIQTSACKHEKPACGCAECPSAKVPTCCSEEEIPVNWQFLVSGNPDYN